MPAVSLSDVLELAALERAQLDTNLAAVVLVWYDYLLTLDDEINLFWRSSWSKTKILFFVNRYLILFTTTLPTGSEFLSMSDPTLSNVAGNNLPTISTFLQVLIVDLILFIRIHAIYERQRLILWLLTTLLVLCTAAPIVVLVVIATSAFRFAIKHARPKPGTDPTSTTSLHSSLGFLWTTWIPVIAYQTITFVLVLRKAYEHLLNNGLFQSGESAYSSDGASSRLITVVYRDSLIYYAGIFALYIANCIVFSLPDPADTGFLVTPTMALIAIMANRLLFNIRSEHQLQEESRRWRSTSTSRNPNPFTTVVFVDTQQAESNVTTAGVGEDIEMQGSPAPDMDNGHGGIVEVQRTSES